MPLSRSTTYLLITVASAALLAFLQWHPSFIDPDSFYHLKITLLLFEQHAPVTQFPWLPLTTLAHTYIDHHFLYHVFLIPFVTIFPPLVGMKISAVVFGTSAILALCWLLEQTLPKSMARNHVYLMLLVCAFLLLTNQSFVERLALPKMPAVSIAWLLLIITCIFKFADRQSAGSLFGTRLPVGRQGMTLGLGVLSFFYVWLYGGWPLIIVVAGIAWLVRAFFEIKSEASSHHTDPALAVKTGLPQSLTLLRNDILKKSAYYLKRIFSWPLLQIPVMVTLGSLAGLVFNPYFPTNLSFLWLQFVKIAVLNMNSSLPVGGEWYPAGISHIPPNSIILILLFLGVLFLLASAIFSLRRAQTRDWKIWFLAFLSFFFIVCTLRSQRFIEYAVPFTVLFSLSALAPVFERLFSQKISSIKTFFTEHPLSRSLILYAILFFLSVTSVNMARLLDIYGTDKFSFATFEGASKWLKENTPASSRVFHFSWDEFPGLFFYNSHNTYISGLDPRFLYEENPKLEEEYENEIYTATSVDAEKIRKDFNADFLFVRQNQKPLIDLIKKDERFEKMYSDSISAIYKIR